MTRPHTPDDQQKSQLIESLLEALYQNNEREAQALLKAGMERIEQYETVPRSTANKDPAPRPRRLVSWQVVGWLSAALILIAVFLPYFDPSRNAMAAVNRSLQQALVDIGRRYSLRTSIHVTDSANMVREADLYVKGGDRFAINARGPLGFGTFWLGSSNGNAWVVPPLGPVILGGTRNLMAWVAQREDVATPYLHLATLLERMRESYELSAFPPAELRINNEIILCRHVLGIRRNKGQDSFPDRIELWADSRTGVAMKVLATWNNDELGRESVTVEFRENIELADGFFSPDQHGGANRPRIGFDSDVPQ